MHKIKCIKLKCIKMHKIDVHAYTGWGRSVEKAISNMFSPGSGWVTIHHGFFRFKKSGSTDSAYLLLKLK